MVVDKEFLIDVLKRHENEKEKIVSFDGKFPKSEIAIQILQKDKREVVPIGECDNQDETGRCLGHNT